MTLELLLAEFDGLIQTPADVEKLNATILQWAVQGRLVPQCEDDEPASALLNRIRDKRKQLLRQKEIKGAMKLHALSKDPIPFNLPSGWTWVRLGEMVTYMGSGSTPRGGKKVYQDNGVKFIRSQNVWNDGLYLEGVAHISKSVNEKMAGTVVRPRDILLNITGASIGRSALVADDFDIGNVSQHVMIIRLIEPEIRQYIHACIISPFFQKTIMDVQVGISREGLSKTRLYQFIVPLPPLAEQKRIVARVDELLGQTAVLTQQLASVNEQRRGVNTAVLHQLTTKTSEVLQTSEVYTLAINFNRLYVDADTVAELKQAILQLAVQGRLVPQEEGDEEAAVLLARIQEEKKLLISQTEGREENAFISLSNGEFTHPLPKNWKWTKVGEVCPYIVPNRDKPKSFTGDIPWITLPDFDEELYLYGSKEGLGLTKEEVNKYRARTVPAGSVIMSCIGRFGITGILKQDSVINQQLHAFLVPKLVDARYLVYALRTQTSYMESQATSTTILYLNKSKCNSVPFPLPPYQEQKRIVAKVDELFALCDQLAGQLATAAASRTQLLEAVLAQA